MGFLDWFRGEQAVAPKENMREKKVSRTILFIRNGAKFDAAELEKNGFHVIQADSIIKGTDWEILPNINMMETIREYFDPDAEMKEGIEDEDEVAKK